MTVFTKGQRVQFKLNTFHTISNFDINLSGLVGTVEYIDERFVSVKLDSKIHEAVLAEWDNCVDFDEGCDTRGDFEKSVTWTGKRNARGIVVRRLVGAHQFGVTLQDGPETGTTFVLNTYATPGWVVDVSYFPEDQFAEIIHVVDRGDA